MSHEKASKLVSVVDLDVDIGADAVDYKCVSLPSFQHAMPMTWQCHCEPGIFVRIRDGDA